MTLAIVALSCIITMHDAMPDVLSTFPERRAEDVDGYIATLDCSDIGREYMLGIAGDWYQVAAADCASRRHIAYIKAKWDGAWCADVETSIWVDANLPIRPAKATLMSLDEWVTWNTRMRRVIQ